jgi:hypothetical protein
VLEVFMKNALLVVSGVSIGLLGALVALASNRGMLPQAEAQTVQADASGATAVMGIGGSAPNLNDLCWVLFKDKGRDKAGVDHDRWALCLYRTEGGKLFDLVDMREVTYDCKPAQLTVKGHNADVRPQAMKDLWEEAKKKEDEARKKREEEEAKKKKPGGGGN